jgi:penicillin G amidase
MASFPTGKMGVSQPVTIHWNPQMVPFVEAQSEHDAAFALGLVHAHLRRGQMELLRRVSAGRIAEMAGPLATDIDHAIRILNLGKAVPEMEKALPPETRAWLTRFVEGIGVFDAASRRKPYEFEAFGWEVEPWSVADVLRISRLAGADVSWLRLLNSLMMKNEKGFEEFHKRYEAAAEQTVAQLGPAEKALPFLSLFSRTGSNSFVVGPKRSASGSAVIANDPHLGILIPNVWLIVGVKCPTLHAVGLSIPGLPFIALGRNSKLAWGGTNMHALSSDLYDVSHLEDKSPEIHSRLEKIQVRWWKDREVKLRDTEWGPLISDAPFFKDFAQGKKIALRWTGHLPSDEITAFLKANRAQSTKEFIAAFDTYAVSGQNILFASANGDIGRILAVALPERTPLDRKTILRLPKDSWKHWTRASKNPVLLNPKETYLASANQKPSSPAPYVGEYFAPKQRAERISAQLSSSNQWGLQSLTQLQQDTYSASSHRLKSLIAKEIRKAAADFPWLKDLELWDGHYEVDSRGAVIHQLLTFALIQEGYQERYSEKLIKALLSSDLGQDFLAQDLAESDPKLLLALRKSLPGIEAQLQKYPQWGNLHRIQLAHPLSFAPAIGKRFIFADLPGSGSVETVYKMAHSISDEEHAARYGSHARHVSDMADENKNYFTLLGGQDGWLGSEHLLDQVPLWLKGESIQVPLSLNAVRSSFLTKTVLLP